MSVQTKSCAASPSRTLRNSNALPWLMAGVAVLAFGVRLGTVLRGGGLFAPSDYDGAVYFTGADSLLSGRIPYHDFLLLHPPGILLVLAPFAALGRVFSDPTGFAVARIFFMLLGALNAALLTRLGSRLGTTAAVFAGTFYALWGPSLYAERTTLLEPLGTTALLVALLLLFTPKVVGRRQLTPTRQAARGELLAGVALGLGASVKIWGVVLVLVIAVWQLYVTSWRASARVVAGAAAAVTAVCLPFYALAPGPMFQMVVKDQIGRPVNSGSFVTRLASISSLDINSGVWGNPPLNVAIGVLACVTLGAAAMVWRQPSCRILVVLTGTTGLVLLVSPSYYRHYGEFVAAPAVLMLAVAAQRLVDGDACRLPAIRRTAIGVLAVPLIALAVALPSTRFGRPFPWPDRQRAEGIAGCVVADDPTGLIELNVLSSDLQRGCHVWVDATGLTYDSAARVTSDGLKVSLLANVTWQRDLMAYLTSGSATVILRHPNAQLTIPNEREITEMRLLGSTGDYRIFARR